MELPAMIDIEGCKTIKELAHRVMNEYEYNGKTIREWADLLTNSKTNADRIRAMSDDVDLAIFLDAVRTDGLLKGQEFPYSKFGWLDWLREDVKEES